MKLRRPSLFQTALATVCLIVFVGGGHFAATAVIDKQRSKQLQELTDVALRRSEVSVDVGGATLDEVAKRGPLSCDPAWLQTVRLQVYQRSAVKDIRSVNRDGSVICSAYSETLEFDNGWVGRPDMLRSSDGRVMLFRVDQINGIALGVLRDVDAYNSLVAILGINANVFDIMPAELRDHSEVLLDLDNGMNVGKFAPKPESELSNLFDFSRASKRYPFRVTVRIEESAFARWNNEAYWQSIFLAGGLGLAFGFLLARAGAKPDGLIADLDRGLAAREFKPFFQPIFDLRSGAVVGCEVLARWVRADGTVVPPMSFIPLAESSGRIEPMTWQILATALSELYPRLRQDKHFRLSLNVVPRHFLSVGFVDKLRRVVSDAKVSPRQIILELTERDEFADLARAAAVVTELREFGFRVAIDDVGVGHSGLSLIKGLGANTIKIDKFFVDTITRDNSALTIVEMLVRLAADLKMTVVAEGIETPEQQSALIACGVEQGQGYIVSPPLPFAKFDQLVEHLQIVNDAAADLDRNSVRVA
jgi:sensor c-di-GMP phosphodiesterase-like protein